MTLLLAFICNRDWFHYAYAKYHGRFGKTIAVSIYNLHGLVLLDCVMMGMYLCFACTFRDVNTNEGILASELVAMNFENY